MFIVGCLYVVILLFDGENLFCEYLCVIFDGGGFFVVDFGLINGMMFDGVVVMFDGVWFLLG